MIKARVKFKKDRRVKEVCLVNDPANESMYVKMSKDDDIVMLANDELGTVTGAVLIPDQEVKRNKKFFKATLGVEEDGVIIFGKEDIEEFAMDYLKHDNIVKLNHDNDKNVSDKVNVLESWLITTEHDKSTDLGFKYPQGTWMMTQKIDRSTEDGLKLWKDIKDNKYNGFSITGNPEIELLSLSKEEDEDEILNGVIDIVTNFK